MLQVKETRYGFAELAVYLVAFVAPWIAVIFLSSFVLSANLVPELSQPSEAAYEAPVILDSLASHLVGISVGILVAGWYIFRQDIRSKAQQLHLIFALANTVLAFSTIFVGLRLRYEIVVIINSAALEMELVAPVLGWQSGLLLCQIGVFNIAAIHFFLNRDRRARL